MNTGQDDASLRKAVSIYKFFLSLYPRKYKDAYAEQMLIVFKDLYREQKEKYGGIGVKFWLEIIADAVGSIFQQYMNKLTIDVLKKFLIGTSIAISVFVIAFFIVSAMIWLFNTFIATKGFATKRYLSSFSHKYSSVIKNDIFNDVFRQAKKCNQLTREEQIQLCRSEVGKTIGDVLLEEELAKDWYWPHDLSFVKKENNTFYKLGWDGELKDISSDVRQDILTDKQSYVPLILQRNCNYFQIANICEVYETLQLDKGNKGYLVRLYPAFEEMEFKFVISLPFYGFLIFKSLLNSQHFSWGNFFFMIFTFINITVPLIIVIFALRFYKRKFREKPKLKKRSR